jgi:hypothetical protein
MASLLRVDEMQSNESPLMRFNTGAFNPVEQLYLTGSLETVWDPEADPVVILPGADISTVLNVKPQAPTVSGMYITIIYPVGVTYFLGGAFDLDYVEVPAPTDTQVHRVYYSSGNLWKEA